MCGIAGWIGLGGKPTDFERVEEMTYSLRHRGPDNQNSIKVGNAALGHARLSIIDPKARSQQPLSNLELGLTIVFNGCIYNFEELRAELQLLGYNFGTLSDTEVILTGYHAWGNTLPTKLDGIFSFLIYDQINKKSFAARDRLGIKPFYYHTCPDAFIFASTPQAILKSGVVSKDIDINSFHHFMSLHGIIPPPRSIFREIKKLPPASCMEFDSNGRIREWSYWDVEYKRDQVEESLGINDWAKLLEDELIHACKRNLISDKSIGILLSGGIDSSILAHFCSQYGQLETYSIGFEDVGDLAGNEFGASDLVASNLGSKHQKILVQSDEVWGHLPSVIKSMSEPMVSHDCMGFYLLFMNMNADCQVAISGQGADELLAGYHWYPNLQKEEGLFENYRRSYFDASHVDLGRQISPTWFAESDVTGDLIRDHLTEQKGSLGLDRILKNDVHRMLPEDPVKRLDNMSGAWGVEARVPFLDYKVVEVAARIPPYAKLKFGGKGVLKCIAEKYLPDSIVYRKKGYFPVPQLSRLEGRAVDVSKQILQNDSSRKRGLFQESFLQELYKCPLEHMTPLGGSVLWKMASLEMWLQGLEN